MPTIPEALNIAIQHHRAGQLREAETIYRQILAADPNHLDAWHLLGLIACQVGKYEAGVECIKRALVLRPEWAEAHFNLGNAWKDQGKLDESIACYQRALQLKPDYAEAHNNLGLSWRDQGDVDRAVACYQRALQLKPDYAEAHNNLGNVLNLQGKLEEATACYQRALELKPGYAEAHNNLGNVFKGQGKFEEAAACFQKALEWNPGSPEAHNNLGNVFMDQGKPGDAAACYQQALRLRPDYAEAHNNLGNVFQDQGELDKAAACYERALQLKPDYALAQYNLGLVSHDRGNLDEAVACYRQALKLDPAYAEAHNNLGNALKDQGILDEAVASFRRAIELKPDDPTAHSNLLYTLLFFPGYDARAIFEEHRLWNRRFAEPLARLIEPHRNDRTSHRRLRIGYVSPDFRDHAQSFFMAPLLAAHDHERFEIFCYADVARPDEITARLRSLAGVWRDIAGLSDDQVAGLVRQDRIDILVDLTMHMARNRLLVFARKPAPVQVSWLAYPGTTGLSTIDYRLTDPYIDPPGLHDRDYSEESIRLADTFWCYDPLAGEPAVSALPAMENGSITFGCLNNFCKVNDSVLKRWTQVLKGAPGSRLLLLAPEGSVRQRTLDLLEREGVERDRVALVDRQPRPQYLEIYQRIDIGLDTFPYNGHTTSLDAFWMGVPVVTLMGPTPVARAGLSLLTNLGLSELVATTPEQFVSIAFALAGDVPRLCELRATLRDRLRASLLMDAPRFARMVEAAYREMWRRWCENQAPERATAQGHTPEKDRNTELGTSGPSGR
jgi:predicted O-linked N-acetylglucosamine transferase (SPINDLY family)